MAEFTLPKHSQPKTGRTYDPQDGQRLKSFRIYRYDPVNLMSE